MSEMNQAAQWEIGRIRALAEIKYLPWVLDTVRTLLAGMKLQEVTGELLVMATEEACLNVIQHAFEPDEQGRYEVSVEKPPYGIIIAIEDQGLTFNPALLQQKESWTDSPENNREFRGLGGHLMLSVVDETTVINRGELGKRIELFKNLPAPDVSQFLEEDDKPGEFAEQPPFDKAMPIRLNFMKPEKDEAVQLSRWVYRATGYKSLSGLLYYPDRIFNLLQSRLMFSCVGKTEDGEIVSHLCLKIHNKNDAIAEICEALVDPRARNNGLFKLMHRHLTNWANKLELYGLYCKASTDSPYMQQGELSAGAKETGIQLSYLPATLPLQQSGGIQAVGEEGRQRQSIVLFYQPITQAPERMIFAPQRHTKVIQEIYKQNQLIRHFAYPKEHPKALADYSELELRGKPDWQESHIRVHEVGRDFTTIIRHHLVSALKKDIKSVIADLPLSDALCPAAVEVLERMGFFFAGILPEMSNGDVLRLQYVHDDAFDRSRLVLVSNFAKGLYSYILDDWTRAGSMNSHVRPVATAQA